MKPIFIGGFFLFACVLFCLFVFILQDVPQKSESAFHNQVQVKKNSCDGRNVAENNAKMVDSYACSTQSPKFCLT